MTPFEHHHDGACCASQDGVAGFQRPGAADSRETAAVDHDSKQASGGTMAFQYLRADGDDDTDRNNTLAVFAASAAGESAGAEDAARHEDSADVLP